MILGRARWSLLVAAGVGLALASPPAEPQRPGMKRGGPGIVRPPGRGPGFPAGRKAPPARMKRQQNMVDHLMSLPPEEQKEFMRNDPRFQHLPSGQQENIQKRLQQFNNLPPGKREALRERFELFRQLPPEQQDRARGLYRQWNQHSPERRQEMMREFRGLRDVMPEERRRRMDSEEFRNRYGEREQELLRGLVELLPPAPE